MDNEKTFLTWRLVYLLMKSSGKTSRIASHHTSIWVQRVTKQAVISTTDTTKESCLSMADSNQVWPSCTYKDTESHRNYITDACSKVNGNTKTKQKIDGPLSLSFLFLNSVQFFFVKPWIQFSAHTKVFPVALHDQACWFQQYFSNLIFSMHKCE